jgi:predicted dehydrogenase
VRRIGIVGTENSHVDHFIRHLNIEQRHPGNRVTALVGGTDPGTGEGLADRNAGLAEAGEISDIVARPEDLIGRVDAVIVTGRDSRSHRDQAVPLLTAGLPVLVDKPLAASVADAREIIAAAAGSGTALMSCSALRHLPDLDAFPRHGIRHLVMTGPADPASPYAGIFFYGIHHVEVAMAVLGDPLIEPGTAEVTAYRVSADGGETIIAQTAVAKTALTFSFPVPRESGRVPFHLQVATDTEVVALPLVLGADYAAPSLARFIGLLDSPGPVEQTKLLSPIVLMTAISEAVDRARIERSS